MNPVAVKVSTPCAAPSLADKLQSKAMSYIKHDVVDEPEAINILKKVIGADEECYEDEEGTLIPCKKCLKKAGNLEQEENKYKGMQEKAFIVKFLKAINEKNYAAAHKYLKQIMETKLSRRIAANKEVKLF